MLNQAAAGYNRNFQGARRPAKSVTRRGFFSELLPAYREAADHSHYCGARPLANFCTTPTYPDWESPSQTGTRFD